MTSPKLSSLDQTDHRVRILQAKQFDRKICTVKSFPKKAVLADRKKIFSLDDDNGILLCAGAVQKKGWWC